MGKIQVVWTAPEGDSKVCEVGGKTFYDGKATEIDDVEDASLLETLKHNKQFKPEGEAPHGRQKEK